MAQQISPLLINRKGGRDEIQNEIDTLEVNGLITTTELIQLELLLDIRERLTELLERR